MCLIISQLNIVGEFDLLGIFYIICLISHVNERLSLILHCFLYFYANQLYPIKWPSQFSSFCYNNQETKMNKAFDLYKKNS